MDKLVKDESTPCIVRIEARFDRSGQQVLVTTENCTREIENFFSAANTSGKTQTSSKSCFS